MGDFVSLHRFRKIVEENERLRAELENTPTTITLERLAQSERENERLRAERDEAREAALWLFNKLKRVSATLFVGEAKEMWPWLEDVE